jgi:hypothetical protein
VTIGKRTASPFRQERSFLKARSATEYTSPKSSKSSKKSLYSNNN